MLSSFTIVVAIGVEAALTEDAAEGEEGVDEERKELLLSGVAVVEGGGEDSPSSPFFLLLFRLVTPEVEPTKSSPASEKGLGCALGPRLDEVLGLLPALPEPEPVLLPAPNMGEVPPRLTRRREEEAATVVNPSSSTEGASRPRTVSVFEADAGEDDELDDDDDEADADVGLPSAMGPATTLLLVEGETGEAEAAPAATTVSSASDESALFKEAAKTGALDCSASRRPCSAFSTRDAHVPFFASATSTKPRSVEGNAATGGAWALLMLLLLLLLPVVTSSNSFTSV